jgi:hypothetical protein
MIAIAKPIQRRYGRRNRTRASCGKTSPKPIKAPPERATARVHREGKLWEVYRSNNPPTTIAIEEVRTENVRPAGSLRRRPKIHKLMMRKTRLRKAGMTK